MRPADRKAIPTVAQAVARADDRERVLREASRLAFGADPPPTVRGWLEQRGVS